MRSTSVTRPAEVKSRGTSAGTAPRRVAKAVLVSAIAPLMLQTPANPGGLPLKVFDDIRAGVLKDRSQFFKDLEPGRSSAPIAQARRCRRASSTNSG